MLYPILLSSALSALAPSGPPVTWSFTALSTGSGVVEVVLTATVEDGWHIYATQLENELGPIPTTIRFTPSEAYTLVDGLAEPRPEEVFDPNFDMQVRYHSGSPRFVQRVKPASDQGVLVKGEVEFMVCNDKTCLPPEVVSFNVVVPHRDEKP